MKHTTATASREGGRGAECAWRHWPSQVSFWLIASVVVVLDLWSKHWVFANLSPQQEKPLFGNFLIMHRSLNDGAVFGSFTGYTSVFVVASLFALGLVVYLFARSSRRLHKLHVSLALILAGAMGNLYDRSAMKADIVRVRHPDGVGASIIGKLVDSPNKSVVLLGSWPEGTKVRTFDRDQVELRRQGVVRDFLRFVPKFPSWVPWLGGRDVWPWVFNVADAALVCGVILLLICSWHEHRPIRPTGSGSA